MPAPIFLLGFMGCGKTTLGTALRAATGVDFVDLDEAIEVRMGMSVKQIFAEHGEAYFRQLEREQLLCESRHGGIVACGGGTPLQAGNMELMNSIGTTVWLQAPEDVLLRRLSMAREQRPLIAALNDNELAAFISAKLSERSQYYSQAQHRFDSSHLESAADIARSVEQFCLQFGID